MIKQQTWLPAQYKYSWWLDTLFLTLVLGGLFFILLGARPLFVPDEGRYAEIAREMVASGDYVTPYLNHIKYFEKPILFYWLESAAIQLSGLSIWSVRSVNALLGLMGCLITYFTARKLYGRTTGILSALILGTSLLYFVMAHMVSLDLPVTVFLAATLYAFLLGTEEPLGIKRRLFFLAASAAAGLAVLTKGLIGIVFPLMIMGCWIALLGEWRILKRLYLPSCVAIFLIITAPWHILVGIRNPEFFYFYFIEQHFLRYTTMEVGHYQPVWFFIPVFIMGFFPWIVFLPQTLRANLGFSWQQRRNYRKEIFLMLWALLIFAFFSFSKSKLIPYILPLFPPLAILTARYLAAGISEKKFQLGIKIGYLFLIAFAAIIACAFYLFSRNSSLLPNPTLATLYLGLAALILMIGVSISYFLARQNILRAIISTLVTMWLFLLVVLAALPSIDSRTILPLAKILQAQMKPQDEIITFNQYYQDLPFYLERRVTILNWRNELSFGMKHQDTSEWMINDDTFWQRFDSKNRVFVILSKDEYHEVLKHHPDKTFFVLGETVKNQLISNQK